MQLNLTLVVQIINFWIAYLMIKYILLKPAIAHIEADEQRAHLITEHIGQWNYQLATLENEVAQHWSMAQTYFSNHRPELARVCPPFLHEIWPIDVSAPTAHDRAVETLTKTLIAQVDHVRV